MHASGLLLPLAALIVWLTAIAWPTVAGFSTILEPAASTQTHNLVGVLITSLCWSAGIAFAATLLGWLPGRCLGGLIRQRRRALGALAFAMLLVPLCIPAYLIFWAWWQAWPPTSFFYQWAVYHRAIPLLRQITLAAGLICWAWPLASWCVAASVAMTPGETDDLLGIDGARLWTRLRIRLRQDATGLAAGAAIIMLVLLNETTSFDLAQVFTFGNELRYIDSLGPVRGVIIAAWPSMLIALGGAIGVWRIIHRFSSTQLGRPGAMSGATAFAGAMIWIITIIVPLGMIVVGLAQEPDVDAFLGRYADSVANALTLSAAVGVLVALIAWGLAAGWRDPHPGVRAATTVQAIGWLIGALSPAIVVAAAHEAAYNNDVTGERMYQTPIILVLSLAARTGFVGVLLGRWIVVSEPAALRDLRLLHGRFGLLAFLASSRPRLLAGGAAAMAITFAMCLSEVSVTARLQPRGFEVIASALLNALHYQRPETIVLATTILIAAACVGSLLAAIVLSRPWRIRASGQLHGLILGMALLPLLTACSSSDSRDPEPLDAIKTFGNPGLSPGQFSYPRAISSDPNAELLYVIDKTARVQRFGFDGTVQTFWNMPEKDNGKPTGVSVSPDGRVFVADTHYFRVMVYDRDGNELLRFGSYGEAPGQFIYPTDVAFGPEGTLYVAEYGGNDRIQVFSPQGEFLFLFGSFGNERGQFRRPQSIAFSHDLSELYIADAANNRIVVTDPKGNVLRMFGSAGFEPGRMHTPYSVCVLDDGSLLVTEFGNNRLQRFTPDGKSLGVLGRLGAGPGELKYPWAAAAAAGKDAFVLDSGNNRVHHIRP